MPSPWSDSGQTGDLGRTLNELHLPTYTTEQTNLSCRNLAGIMIISSLSKSLISPPLL